MWSCCSLSVVSLIVSVIVISGAGQGTAQFILCFTNSGDSNCVGTDVPLTVADCCSSATVRRTYREQGSEICNECLFTYQCYTDQLCGSGEVAVTSQIAGGETQCCNGSFSSWSESTNPTCNMCPVKETTTRSETSADTTETSTTPQDLDSSTTVGNTITESAQTGSGCSAGCIAGVVLGAVALVTAIGVIAAVVVIFITRK